MQYVRILVENIQKLTETINRMWRTNRFNVMTSVVERCLLKLACWPASLTCPSAKLTGWTVSCPATWANRLMTTIVSHSLCLLWWHAAACWFWEWIQQVPSSYILHLFKMIISSIQTNIECHWYLLVLSADMLNIAGRLHQLVKLPLAPWSGFKCSVTSDFQTLRMRTM